VGTITSKDLLRALRDADLAHLPDDPRLSDFESAALSTLFATCERVAARLAAFERETRNEAYSALASRARAICEGPRQGQALASAQRAPRALGVYRVYRRGEYPRPARDFYRATFASRRSAKNFCRNRSHEHGLTIVHPDGREERYQYAGFDRALP
jgi:hypothetical protein